MLYISSEIPSSEGSLEQRSEQVRMSRQVVLLTSLLRSATSSCNSKHDPLPAASLSVYNMWIMIVHKSFKINGCLCSAPAPMEQGLHPLSRNTATAILSDLLGSEEGGKWEYKGMERGAVSLVVV